MVETIEKLDEIVRRIEDIRDDTSSPQIRRFNEIYDVFDAVISTLQDYAEIADDGIEKWSFNAYGGWILKRITDCMCSILEDALNYDILTTQLPTVYDMFVDDVYKKVITFDF